NVQNRAAGSESLIRAAFAGGAIEHRFAADRLAVSANAATWTAFRGGRAFCTGSVKAAARSAAEPAPFKVLPQLRADFANEFAPLSVWPGAGDGRARPGLLRAHPLLHDGVIEGPALGRYVQSATVEVQRWFTRPTLPRVGLAVFTDAAHATQRLD